MTFRFKIDIRVAHIAVSATLIAVCALFFSCELSEDLDNSRKRIETELKNSGIYERGNLPYPPPTDQQLKGYYDVIGGAYRRVMEENRPTRNQSPEIFDGDNISFYFDARVYSGSFDNSKTFYTNIEARIQSAAGSNAFDGWSTDPLQITLPNDPGILKAVQNALIGCRADNNDPTDDDADNGIKSDVVRVYVPYDIGFGNNWVYNVPPKSTLVFEISGIQKL
jgi:hypothetical protein